MRPEPVAVEAAPTTGAPPPERSWWTVAPAAADVDVAAAALDPLAGAAGIPSRGAHGRATWRPWAIGVGSNGTQPTPAKYASTQACASLLVISRLPSGRAVPGVYPRATRAGIPAARTSTAIAPAYCSQ